MAKVCGSQNAAERSKQTILPSAVEHCSTAAAIELTETNRKPDASAAPLTELISIRSVEQSTITGSEAGAERDMADDLRLLSSSGLEFRHNTLRWCAGVLH